MTEPRALGVVLADGFGNLTFSETRDGFQRGVQAAPVPPRLAAQPRTTRTDAAAQQGDDSETQQPGLVRMRTLPPVPAAQGPPVPGGAVLSEGAGRLHHYLGAVRGARPVPACPAVLPALPGALARAGFGGRRQPAAALCLQALHRLALWLPGPGGLCHPAQLLPLEDPEGVPQERGPVQRLQESLPMGWGWAAVRT